MDLNFSAEDIAFRDEVRTFIADNYRRAAEGQVRRGRGAVEGGFPQLAQGARRQGLGRHRVARRIWRHRLDERPALHLRRGERARRRDAAAAVRPQHGRPGDLHLRHARAEGEVPAAHPVAATTGGARAIASPAPAVGPRQPADQGRALHRRRRQGILPRQRPEDVDDAGPARRLDLLSSSAPTRRSSRRKGSASC